jgi:hypothetical protein
MAVNESRETDVYFSGLLETAPNPTAAGPNVAIRPDASRSDGRVPFASSAVPRVVRHLARVSVRVPLVAGENPRRVGSRLFAVATILFAVATSL